MQPHELRLPAVAAQLAATGLVAVLETHGRKTGQTAVAAVGFFAEPDGSLLVAAGDPGADWALNLLAAPDCWVQIGEDRFACTAEPIDAIDRATAVRELILRYGTPAERLGAGPAFRLRPDGERAPGV
ncbi:MAG TPA: nitroreductase family deazaflavin-dependent oxidoreductase [Candidatus Saccharimonadales bacterium]|nr:nitroreductase family deazaflavin-dependent oxidoreductase [Candidatus Saccharimonadales bacterium]